MPPTPFWAREVDFDLILDRYHLVVKPLPAPDDERRWCVAPYCRNDARPKGVLCRGHNLIATRGNWNVSELIARELHKAARPGTGCANPACPASDVTRPSRVADGARQRQYAPRRFWGGFTPGGEYLCRVCADLVNQVADAFDPELSPTDKAVERMLSIARASIPHATYLKLTGQQLLRSKQKTVAELTLADGYTLDQFALGLAQYVGFWAEISELQYVRSAGTLEFEQVVTTLNEVADQSVQLAINAGELPDYSIPYTPGQIVVDAMLGRFPEGE